MNDLEPSMLILPSLHSYTNLSSSQKLGFVAFSNVTSVSTTFGVPPHAGYVINKERNQEFFAEKILIMHKFV